MEIKSVDNKCWTPVRVKPKQEKKLVEYCKAKGVENYLPLLKRVHRYERRTAVFHVPMFPGYVFCCLDEDLFSKIVLSNAIVYQIPINDYEEEGLIEELKAIQAFEKLSNEADVVVKPELAEGSVVTVARGAMAGVDGVVVRRKGKVSITVNVEILGQSATVEIDAGDLEPV